MLLKDRVLNFIEPMQNRQTIEYFVNENSFWFAYLLKGRFDHAPYNATIVYDDSEPDDYYFAVKIGDNVYDITGVITKQAPEWKSWLHLWHTNLDLAKEIDKTLVKETEYD